MYNRLGSTVVITPLPGGGATIDRSNYDRTPLQIVAPPAPPVPAPLVPNPLIPPPVITTPSVPGVPSPSPWLPAPRPEQTTYLPEGDPMAPATVDGVPAPTTIQAGVSPAMVVAALILAAVLTRRRGR